MTIQPNKNHVCRAAQGFVRSADKDLEVEEEMIHYTLRHFLTKCNLALIILNAQIIW